MLYHGSVAGAFSLKDSVLETLQCMRRAGKQHCNVKIFMCQCELYENLSCICFGQELRVVDGYAQMAWICTNDIICRHDLLQ